MKTRVETLLAPILRPVIKYCLRNSFYLQDIVELIKRLMQEEAARILTLQAEKVNASRVSALTGIHRKDLVRLKDSSNAPESRNIMTRMIGQWQFDKRFSDGKGKARLLKLDDTSSSFKTLVESVSTDLHPGTVLFELERANLVKRRGNVVRLLAAQHVVKNDTKAALSILSSDLDDLICAVQKNVSAKEAVHLHGRTEFDNIDPESVPRIRKWLIKEGREFHKRTREFLSKFDYDINPNKSKGSAGVRVSLGTFSFDNQEGRLK